MHVVLATDGSEEAEAAASLLIAGARRDTVTITAFSVATLADTAPGWPPDYLKDAVAEDLERAERTSRTVAEHLAQNGFRSSSLVGTGHPGAQVLHELDRGTTDLVVMGYGRHRWLGTRLLGSTGSFLLQEAPTSVLLAHRAPASLERCRVLLATDGSAEARVAASGLEGFLDPHRCSIKVVTASAMPPKWSTAVDSGLTAPYVGPPLTPDALEELLQTERALSQAGFAAETEMVFGPVKSSLLNAVRDGQFDLAVVGSRGLGPIRRALMGSVSEALVNHAPATLVGRARLGPAG
ncbi:MAG TPA: universal stress protein [Actinomycetota bacterium]|nr:universal stress protein [Actinomycetota bacterium]